MRRITLTGRRMQLGRKNHLGRRVQGGSLGGQRDDLYRAEEMKNALPKGELGQSNMDATIKRNLIRKGKVLGNTVSQKAPKQISGGTMMAPVDPLESVKLPKFVNGKKLNRNNIKISL